MVEIGNSLKQEKKGSKKCCCAISTLVVILFISGLAFVYREKIMEEFIKLRSESSENLDDSELTTLYVEESLEERTTVTTEKWTTSTDRIISTSDIDETTKYSDKTQNESDENDEHSTIRSPVLPSTTTLWEGSGLDPRDHGKSSIKSKPFESDDEDYQDGFATDSSEGSG